MKTVASLCSAGVVMGFLFFVVQSIDAQVRAKVPQIGIITTGSSEALAHLLEGFKQGLREHGYAEGQTSV